MLGAGGMLSILSADWWWTRAMNVFKGVLTRSGPDGNTSVTYDLGDAIIYSGKMVSSHGKDDSEFSQ